MLLHTTGIAGVLSAAISTAALAQGAIYTFDIPAEPLSLALQDVAKTSGKQIIFAEKLVAGKSTAGLHGAFTVNAAMNVMRAKTTSHSVVRPVMCLQTSGSSWT